MLMIRLKVSCFKPFYQLFIIYGLFCCKLVMSQIKSRTQLECITKKQKMQLESIAKKPHIQFDLNNEVRMQFGNTV